MLDAHALFNFFRKTAYSFDAYLRTLTYHQKIKGFKRLEKAIEECERKDRESLKKT